MLRNTIIKIVPYFVRNRLFIYLKIINRSDGLSLDLDGIRVTAGGKVYKPLNVSSSGSRRMKMGKVKIKLQRNGRLFYRINYGVIPAVRRVSLSLPGMLDGNNRRIFIAPLVYSRRK